MMDPVNETPWPVQVVPGWDREGRPQVTVVLKATWSFDTGGRLEPVDRPPAPVAADAWRGDPGDTSLAAARETVPFKAGSELLLSGTAHPPPGAVAMKVSVALRRPGGDRWSKTVAVIGERRWERRPVLVQTPPQPLAATPLIYEHAFGGRDPDNEDRAYALNPVGRGYNPRPFRLTDTRLPLVESEPLLRGPHDRPPPAGFGPLSPLWEPRAGRLGEVDEGAALAAEACPWPAPLDPHAHHAAPQDQWFPRPLAGGEVLELAGLFPGRPPSEPVSITLPALRLRAGARVRGEAAARPLALRCDTLVVDADARRLSLVFRGALAGLSLHRARGVVAVSLEEQGP